MQALRWQSRSYKRRRDLMQRQKTRA